MKTADAVQEADLIPLQNWCKRHHMPIVSFYFAEIKFIYEILKQGMLSPRLIQLLRELLL